MIRKLTSVMIAFVLALPLCFAQTKLVVDGKAVSRIVVNSDARAARTAANLLQRFVAESSGATLPVVENGKVKPGDVVIEKYVATDSLKQGGFHIYTGKDNILHMAGKGKGDIYGVVTLLENYLGMNYMTADTYTLDKNKDIVIPVVDIVDNPAFSYRQSQGYGMRTDSVYRMFLRLEEPSDLFINHLWVHTFDRLLPSSVYGESHPEYYSFINGERRPGSASQLCLTNPEVFELVAARLDSLFKAHPDRNMISVSQNDGNFTYCHCEECELINNEEGSPAGSYIYFLNKLADRFPDKEISTLAYLFTMKPPKNIKPRPNVNIMLCDIDCEREVPLTDNASGREFVEALEGWAAITDNIFVWDYGINFDNMIAPFPNFPVLKPNIELFKKNGVDRHFSQIGGAYGGDFSEMRTWVVSKLMWNPARDTDDLMLEFMGDYYGPAAPYIYRYEKLLEGGLLASGNRLWIYDSPVSHKDGMLNKASRKRYGQLFDQAEQAVAGDSVLLRRVHLARLPLIFSNLEIARTTTDKDPAAVASDLDKFEEYITKYGVKSLDERNTSTVDYCRLYRERYMDVDTNDIAIGGEIEWIIEPAPKYKALGEKTLTDGLYGGTSYVDSWTGWEGTDGAFIVDLGDEKEFSSVSTDFLHQLGAWILLPKGVKYSVSYDKTNWENIGEVALPEDRSRPVKFVPVSVTTEKPVKARYIKAEIEGTKICPSWHYGVGCPSWFFADEIIVK